MKILIDAIVRFLFGARGAHLSAEDLEISRRICALKGLRVDGGGVSISPRQIDPGEPEFLKAALDHMRLQGSCEGFLSYRFWVQLGRPCISRYVAASRQAVEAGEVRNLRFSEMVLILEESLKDDFVREK
jgi:hypothetical protein